MLCYRAADDDDDDDFPGSNFEMELANMEREVEELMGEGPENQHTNIKWVRVASKFSLISVTKRNKNN